MKKPILLLITAFLSACANSPEDAPQTTSSQEVTRDANDPDSILRIAETMKKSGDYDMATKFYRQALQLNPNLLDASIGLSQCLRFTGRQEMALEVLEAVPASERTVMWHKAMGSVYSANHNPRKCIESYKQAHAANPQDVGTINGLGVCHDILGQHVVAQKWYNQALALSPNNNHLKSNLGLSLSLANKTTEGIEILSSIVNGQDATPRDRQNLAIAYGLSGDLDKAAKMFSIDLKESEVRTNLAFVHKLASSQHLMAEQKTDQHDVFTTNLASHSVQNPTKPKSTPDVTLDAHALDDVDPIETSKDNNPQELPVIDDEPLEMTKPAATPEKETKKAEAPAPEKPKKKPAAKKPTPAKKTAEKKPAKKIEKKS